MSTEPICEIPVQKHKFRLMGPLKNLWLICEIWSDKQRMMRQHPNSTYKIKFSSENLWPTTRSKPILGKFKKKKKILFEILHKLTSTVIYTSPVQLHTKRTQQDSRKCALIITFKCFSGEIIISSSTSGSYRFTSLRFAHFTAHSAQHASDNSYISQT